LPRQHRAPRALGAVDGALVPAAADAGLEDGVVEGGLAELVLARPPAVELLGVDAEGALDRRLHGDRRPHRELVHGYLLRRPHSSSSSFSTASRKAASARFQNSLK